MVTNKTKIYTKDKELIEMMEEIYNWIRTYTPPCGTSNVALAGRKFKESSYKVATEASFQCTEEVNTSQQTLVTFFVVNLGDYDAVVKLQISPNNSKYMDDGTEISLRPGEIKALVPMIFAKYTHLCYKSASDTSTSLEIIIQSSV